MSAYVMRDEVICSTVQYLSECPSTLSFLAEGADLDLRLPSGRANFAAALGDLNRESVARRYNEAKESPLVYRLGDPVTTKIQAYKNLRCWMYQSCECGCDDAKLYKTVSWLCDFLAHEIIQATSGYKNATWG